MRTVRGICRVVILVGPYAIKMPTTRPYGRRGDRLYFWARGLSANINERQWSDYGKAQGGIAPVLWSFLGLVQVYPRCQPVDPADWKDAPIERYRAVSPVMPTGDKKPENLGILDGQTVWLDYDTSWNGCPGTAWHLTDPDPEADDFIHRWTADRRAEREALRRPSR